jgi:exopolysaccharide biosynthesis polyprenyl glycosylphosphotransferase
VATTIFFFFREPVPRGVFIIFFCSAFILVVYFRKILNQRMLSSIQWRALIVGDGRRSLEVAQAVSSSTYLRTKVVGYVSGGNGSLAGSKLSRLGGMEELVSIARKESVDQIIVAVPTEDDDLRKLLLQCMREKIKVSEFRRVIEEITGKVPIDHLNDNWFLHELSTSSKRYFWYMKRLADIGVSCVGLCLALPLLPVIALLIKLDSRGPLFYCQQRMGRGSAPFLAWKLRTMVDGADRNNVHWTTDNDNRITRVGRIIRKTRLDEVPQLLNIFKGEMTLIGPRPEALSLVEMYTKAIAYYPERHMVTPGITGWAQINYPYGNSIEDTRQKLMYDFYYIKNRSVVLDLMIFLRTIRIMLTGKGAM